MRHKFRPCSGSVLTAYLSQEYGWRAMFAIIGFCGMVWLVPWIRVAPPRHRTPYGTAAAPKEARHAGKRWVTVNRNLVGVCIGFFCYNYRWYLLMTWLPTYLVKERGMTILGAGMFVRNPLLVICRFCNRSADALVICSSVADGIPAGYEKLWSCSAVLAGF